MEKHELNYDNSNEIVETIKNIILDRHPIVNDRIDTIMKNNAPNMDIYIHFYNEPNNITGVMFLDGTINYKSSIPERIIINDLISSTTVNKLIQFILSDHDIIKSINITKNEISLLFNVDLKEQNMCGISCGNIGLTLDFYGYTESNDLLDKYFKSIVTTFHKQLIYTEWYKQEYEKYRLKIKTQIINSLTETDLHKFINLLSNEDICNLLFDMPDDRFGEIYNQLQNIENSKELVKVKK